MKIEVPISEQSEKIIRETFSEYKEVQKLSKKLLGRTIIHMYPVEDTIKGEGELEGFEDSILFHVDIYNATTKTVYKRKVYHDEIIIEIPVKVRIFKDLSTMVVISQNVSIGGSQSLYVYPI
jgi:hypothetical protein